MKTPSHRALLGLLSGLAFAGAAHAQLGTGWTQYSPNRILHHELHDVLYSINPAPSSYSDYACSYNNSGGVETFKLLNPDSNRIEIRLQNEYSTGRRQFEGYLTFFSPLNNESLMQIFGSTSGATLAMTRGYSASGGSITVTSTGGTVWGSRTILTGCYGIENRVNVIHSQDNYIQWYVNGSLKCQQSDPEPGVTNYHKYGCYGTLTTGSATVQWRNVKHFQDGYPSKVEVYQNCSYGGWKVSLVCGDYTLSQLQGMGFVNDDASSIKVPSGYKVTLYTGDNFTGTAVTKTADDSCLTDDGINDQVSSIQVTVN